MGRPGHRSIAREFEAVSLGDKRLDRRLETIVRAMEGAPGDSFVEQAGTAAALEATYRFFSNQRVSAEALFEGHAGMTAARARSHEQVFVVHDTTEFRFGGANARKGMGRVSTSKRDGFLAHYSLCLAPDGDPLGTLELVAWSRLDEETRPKENGSLRNPDRESQRWMEAVERASQRLTDLTIPIHVMDREGDHFELLASMLDIGQRFVVRLGHDRRLKKGRGRDGHPMLNQVLGDAPVRFAKSVVLGRRERDVSSSKRSVFPERDSRIARLEVRATTLNLHRSHQQSQHLPDHLTLNFVEAKEIDAPPGSTPVLWRLVTTESITTDRAVDDVLEIYRKRWLIEEFFKAIKTGCRFESHQLEDIKGLLVALVLESAIAWQLLRLRHTARNHPDAPGAPLLTRHQLAALNRIRASRGEPLNPLSVRHVVQELARLGVHLRNNGPPGWLVLKRGLRKLDLLADGILLANYLSDSKM